MKHGTMEEMATCRPCCMHLSFGYVLLLDSARASAVCAFYMRKGQHKKVLGWRSLTHYSLDMVNPLNSGCLPFVLFLKSSPNSW